MNFSPCKYRTSYGYLSYSPFQFFLMLRAACADSEIFSDVHVPRLLSIFFGCIVFSLLVLTFSGSGSGSTIGSNIEKHKCSNCVNRLVPIYKVDFVKLSKYYLYVKKIEHPFTKFMNWEIVRFSKVQ